MFKHLLILLAVLLFSNNNFYAQTAQDEKSPRIAILLDGSSSLLHDWTKDNIRF